MGNLSEYVFIAPPVETAGNARACCGCSRDVLQPDDSVVVVDVVIARGRHAKFTSTISIIVVVVVGGLVMYTHRHCQRRRHAQ